MIVADVGCANHGIDSVRYLIARFHPRALYGFDPWPAIEDQDYADAGVSVAIRRAAAWIHDGEVAYTPAGTGSHVGAGEMRVACFDFARWLTTHGAEELVVKLDAEGAEYPLLEHLITTGTDGRISLLLVEWHDGVRDLPGRLACPIEEWTL